MPAKDSRPAPAWPRPAAYRAPGLRHPRPRAPRPARMARSAFPRPVPGHVGWCGAMIGHMGSAAGSDAVAGGGAGPGAGGIVSRPRLFERLGASARVTVVSAPPGSGKTVLLRSWIGAAGLAERVAWVAV